MMTGRKLLSLLLAGALGTSLLGACAGTAGESTEEQPDTENYAGWTKTEWNAASKEARLGAARYVLIEVASRMTEGFSELVNEMERNAAAQKEINESAEELKDSIRIILGSSETMTIGDIIEAS